MVDFLFTIPLSSMRRRSMFFLNIDDDDEDDGIDAAADDVDDDDNGVDGISCDLIFGIRLKRAGKSISKKLPGLIRPLYWLKSIVSPSDMQHENSHLFSPQPSTWWPPWIQQENDNVHDRITLLCVHSLGKPSTDCNISTKIQIYRISEFGFHEFNQICLLTRFR